MSVFPNSLFSNSSQTIRITGCVIAAITLLAAVMESKASAQSGRRAITKPPITTSPASVELTNPPATAAGKGSLTVGAQPKVKLLFARQITSKHFSTEDVISATFFKRLTDYLNFDCISIGDLKQARAIAREIRTRGIRRLAEV
jgi:hypothetical protein